MANIKLNLRKGQYYNGTKAYGVQQKEISEVVRKLLDGTIEIEPAPLIHHEAISFRVTREQLFDLKLFAASKNISVQECLRRGLEQTNLTVQQ